MVRSERQMNGDAIVEDMNPLHGVDGIRILIILYAISLIGINFQRLDNVVKSSKKCMILEQSLNGNQ